MPSKKGVVKKIKKAIARKRRPGEVFKVKKVVGKGSGRIKTTRSTGVTNSTKSKVRTSNMTKMGVDGTRKPKASISKDMKGKRVGTRTKTVSMDNTIPGLNKKSRVGKIKKVKENYATGAKKTTTKTASYKKTRKILKKMDKKTDRMINKVNKKTAKQAQRRKY
tara:strand:- start:11 stop:502 length:492 start_codon:yes stop_codon:yes gene_type:complete